MRTQILHGLHDKPLDGNKRELTDRLEAYWHRIKTKLELDKGTRSNGNSRPGILRFIAPRWWFDRIATYFHDDIFGNGGVWTFNTITGQYEWRRFSFTEANLLYLDLALLGAKHFGHRLWACTAWAALQFTVYPWCLWCYYRCRERI